MTYVLVVLDMLHIMVSTELVARDGMSTARYVCPE